MRIFAIVGVIYCYLTYRLPYFPFELSILLLLIDERCPVEDL